MKKVYKQNGGFLFVDWMWNGAIADIKILKSKISKEIQSSSQFLFLRTTNSELRIKGNVSIRQWCAWEMGNFYSKNKNEKYLLNFYNGSTKNTLLNTFKIMDGIAGGKIVSN